jgi:hypothetical protein
MRNYTGVEGRSFEFDNQVLVSSRRKPLLPKAVLVSVAETRERDSGKHRREGKRKRTPHKRRKRIARSAATGAATWRRKSARPSPTLPLFARRSGRRPTRKRKPCTLIRTRCAPYRPPPWSGCVSPPATSSRSARGWFGRARPGGEGGDCLAALRCTLTDMIHGARLAYRAFIKHRVLDCLRQAACPLTYEVVSWRVEPTQIMNWVSSYTRYCRMRSSR